jgi:hypothetical protein
MFFTHQSARARVHHQAPAFAILVAMLIGGVAPHRAFAQDKDPVLTKAAFSSHTLDEDKDHDTGIYVKVRTKNGKTLIAHVDNRDNSGDDGTQYKDQSDHSFNLDIDADGLTYSRAEGAKVEVCIHTKGTDT